MWSNLPRKFNIAVSGGRDDFSHTHINDIGLQPCRHAVTGEMGFNVVLGGYMSTKRVAESIDMNPNPHPTRTLTLILPLTLTLTLTRSPSRST